MSRARGDGGAGSQAGRPTHSVDISGEVGQTRDTRAFDQLLALYDRWLPDGQNIVTAAILSAYAATMRLPGHPAWLVPVGGSGGSKTERLSPLSGLPGTVTAGEISGPAALLVVAKPSIPETDMEITGGLLMQIGMDKTGVLLVPDFSTVLALSRDVRNKTIAAFRMIFDGNFPRSIGGAGGGTATWQGKCGFIGCVTDNIDGAIKVIDALGPRWFFIRLNDTPDIKSAESAYDNGGREEIMRSQLRAATHEIFSNPQKPFDEIPARQLITNLSMILSRGRSSTERDKQGNLVEVKNPEHPTRIAKTLKQFYLGAGIIGMPDDMARAMVGKIALDSVPRLRGQALRVLAAHADAGTLTTGEVAKLTGQPDRSVARALEDMGSHGLVLNENPGRGHIFQWRLSDDARGWFRLAGSATGIDSTSPDMSTMGVGQPRVSRGRTRGKRDASSDNNGMPEYTKDVLDNIISAETAEEIFEAQE
jgi:hypothetical protein